MFGKPFPCRKNATGHADFSCSDQHIARYQKPGTKSGWDKRLIGPRSLSEEEEEEQQEEEHCFHTTD